MNSFQEKSYTHLGIPIIGFLLLSVIISLVFLVRMESINEFFYILLLMMVACLFGMLCFYNITITINNSYLSFKLGIGLIKKSYKIADIKSCEPYSGISRKIGIGTKISFSGNVLKYYIVTGFEAIEIRFHNKKTIVRIGTPLSEEISQQIQSLIKEQRNRDENVQFVGHKV